MNGHQLIAAERRRQVRSEHWLAYHDDRHKNQELAKAASRYIRANTSPDVSLGEWPWEESWFKPSPDAIRNLVKAGALLAAEIDRLQRLKKHDH